METLDRPFAQAAGPAHHVELTQFERILTELEETIRDGDGLSVLTGSPGSGKTHCARVLMSRLSALPDSEFAENDAAENDDAEPATEAGETEPVEQNGAKSFRVILLEAIGLATRRATLQAALHQLQVPFIGLSEQEARLQLLDAARTCADAGLPIVLILDEADRTSHRILEDLRCLTNFIYRDEPLFRVVLVGDTRLEEELGTSSLEAVNHRIVCQTTLSKLSLDQSAEYIDRKMQLVGLSADASFESDAIDAICEIAAGNLRAINILADKSLELAIEERRPQGDAPLEDDFAEDGLAEDGEFRTDNSLSDSDESESPIVSRDDVLAAFDSLENLPVSWRRPLVDDDGFLWTQKRRADELLDLEPIDGEVVEIGGEQTPPPRSMDALAPLRRMHEILGDDAESASLLASLSISPAPANDAADAVSSENEEAVECVEADRVETEDTSDKTDACDAATGDTVLPFDEAETVANASAPDDQILPVFSTTLPVADIRDEEREQAEGDDAVNSPAPRPLLNELSIESDQTQDLEQVDESQSSDEEIQSDSIANDGSTTNDSRDHAECATQIVDAMLPLIQNEFPDESQVLALEALLGESDPDGRGNGEEDTLGGDTLDLVAQISAAVGSTKEPDLSGQDDLPGFAFEEGRTEPETDSTPSEDAGSEKDWANEESTVGLSQLATESSPASNRNAGEPDESAFQHRYDGGSSRADAGRLNGLFTRLRASRNR